ncbi:putative receptor protein kinase ZmPK1 [Panicum virgatum]|uniref:putative receptor protein kinase ZmPK1 n=1 Tax=Panicum virgatum TaxID=38727 RepID=UPI0019D62DCE|nr:putative receptor protein kinase ZmPK1 [Panicum virgatum]
MSSFAPTLLLITVGLLHASPPAGAARGSLTRGAAIAVEDHATDFLVSPDGTFACGFYNVSPTVFTVSVWFARAAGRTVVWTAAPARPVHSRGARLALVRRGGALVLMDYDGAVVWNSTTAQTAARARLHDTGNLVLEDAGGNTLWQSFVSPTDTLLPAQRFTAARHLVSRGGRGRLLAAGYYSLGFSDYAMLSLFYDNHNFSSIYWPNPYNNYVANKRKIYNFTREAALDALGQFLSSDDAGFVADDLGASVRRRLTLDADGDLRLSSLDAATGAWTVAWMAFGNPCIIHGVCGANAVCLYAPAPACVCAPVHERADPGDWTMGCRPVFRHDCSRLTKLVALPHTDFWGYDLNDGEIIPFDTCAQRCLGTCACVAFQHKQNMECYLKSVLFNGRTFPGLPGTVYIKVPADFDMPEFQVHQWREHGGALAIDEDIPRCDIGNGGAEVLLHVSTDNGATDVGKPLWPYLYGFLSAILVVEVVIIGFGCWLFSSEGLFRPSRVWAVEEGYKLITSNFQGGVTYTYSEIKRATGNFTDVIGRGGSGVVYKGILEDDRVVAVKVLKNVSQSEQEFQSELSVIGRIYHMNLVRMWGCCSEGKHRILVSEHIENGSLAEMLFDMEKASDTVLDWNQRFQIALGVAKGLAYLHSECLEWIIHCDMKPENILLDKDLGPKITDFGLAKLLNRDGSDADLSRIRGTRGYMAPEWVSSSLPITEKVDVYSYGVVLLELVKGVRISEWVVHGVKFADMDTRMVAKAIHEKMENGEQERWVKDLIDHRLKGEFDHVQAKAMLKIAISCLEEDRGKRPNMSTVLQALMSVGDEAR